MGDLRIIPRAANSFDLELLQWQGDKEVVVGRLEIHTDGKAIHILRREGQFQKFKVELNEDPREKRKLLAETHTVDIIL